MNKKYFSKKYFSKKYIRYYDEGDESANKENVVTLTVSKDPKTGRPIYKDPTGNVFLTQEHANKEIGNARVKVAEQNKATLAELQTLRDQAGNTEETNHTLQGRIDELQSLQLTTEQQFELKLKQTETSLKDTTEKLTAERNSWQTRYETERIASEITGASSKHKAVSSEQITAILSGKTKLAPVMGEDGKPTGKYATQVAFDDVDKEGKPVTLTLTVDKAIERMRQLPDRFGNLFKHDQVGGLESSTLHGKSGYSGEGPPKTQKEYEAFREQNAAKLGFSTEKLGALG